MPLDREFLNHLQSLMTEVFTGVVESEARYKAELLWQARQRKNAGGILTPYKDAEIHALTTRFEQTSSRYLDALESWGGVIDDSVEREMISQFHMLAAGPSALYFPPGIDPTTTQAIQGAYARERLQVTNHLVRVATNRLKELKMKAKRPVQSAGPTNIYNGPVFNGPVGTANINSPHSYTSNVDVQITPDLLLQIEAISKGDVRLEAAAKDIHIAHAEKKSALDKVQRWATLLQTGGNMMVEAHQHYPEVIAWLKHLGLLPL